MLERNDGGTPRVIILVGVLALHLGILAWMLLASRTRNIAVSNEQPVELMVLPPVKTPKVRAENIRLERVSTNVAMGLAPPLLNSSPQSGASSAPEGHGLPVNWTAEAHRALRAFEIRRDHPPGSALSFSSSWDEWWAREHHAGDQFKTDSGDWIVWINANCYQVASWHGNAMPLGGSPPQTICRSNE